MTQQREDKGTFLWRFSQKFQFAADKIIPESMVFCLILTFIVFIAALIFTGTGPVKLAMQWYDGMWTQLAFSMQMSLMVIVCAATAKSKYVTRAVNKLATYLRSPAVAMCVLMVWGYIASFINWAFCTMSCTVLAVALCKRIKGIHFPMMIVAGYCTSCLGQTLSPTCAVYGLLATEGNYMQEYFGRTLSQAETVYNPVNIAMFLTLAILTMVLAVVTRPPVSAGITFAAQNAVLDEEAEWLKTDRSTPAGKMNGSRIIMFLIGIIGLIAIVYQFATKGFLGALTLNFIITIFLTANCFLYSTPSAFIGAHKDCMKLGTEVMFQFPFYGGIAGIMSSSGLAAIVVSALVKISTAQTLPVVAYLSSAVVNLFIPSQGGQFIIQGPLLMDAAQKLGADMVTVVNGFVYGDQVTNLIQPLYIIAALATTGSKLKDVWGFMAFMCVFWLVFTIAGLLLFPMIF